MLGVTLRWTDIPSMVETVVVASRKRKRDKLWPNGSLGSYAVSVLYLSYRYNLPGYYGFDANISFTFQAVKNLSAHPTYLCSELFG